MSERKVESKGEGKCKVEGKGCDKGCSEGCSEGRGEGEVKSKGEGIPAGNRYPGVREGKGKGKEG